MCVNLSFSVFSLMYPLRVSHGDVWGPLNPRRPESGRDPGHARDKLWALCFVSPLTQWAFIFRKFLESLFVFPVPEVLVFSGEMG